MPGTIDRAVIRMTVGFAAMAKDHDLEPAVAIGTIDRDLANGIALLLQNSMHEAIGRLPTSVDIEADRELGRMERIAQFLLDTRLIEPDAASDIADTLEELRVVVSIKPRIEGPVPY